MAHANQTLGFNESSDDSTSKSGDTISRADNEIETKHKEGEG